MHVQSVLPGVSGLPLSARPLLSTHELAQANHVTTRMVDRVAFSAQAAVPGIKIDLTGVALDRLQVFGVRHAVPTAVCSAPLRSHHIVMPLRGRMQARSGTTATEFGPGKAFVCLAGARLDVRWPAESIALVVTIDHDLFDRVCVAAQPQSFPGAVLPATLDLSAGPGRSFANLLACLCSECNTGAGSPTVLRGLEELVLKALVEMARPANRPPGVVRSTDRRRRGLQRALEYLRSDPRRHPDVDELARVACLSRRSLETAFVEHLGTGPRAFVKRERLEGARSELMAGTTGSIASIAARWGFDDASRFARLYRRMFAELPSATRVRIRHGR